MSVKNLPLARYQFRFKITSPFKQAEFSGSMLRGAFGHALKKITCITRNKDCKACLMYQSCLYPAIFETPPREHSLQKFTQIPNPYIIEPPPWGEREYQVNDDYIFNMVLTGQALQQLSLMILVWQQVFKNGLGKMQGKGILQEVYLLNAEDKPTLIYQAEDEQIKSHNNVFTIPEFAHIPETLVMSFKTPLRMQKHSKSVNTQRLTARDVLITLARRINLINHFHNNQNLIDDFKTLSQQAETIQCTKNLHWKNWIRYSNRQHQKMNFGGLMGEVTLSGNLQPFIEFLYLGQWLHIGKNVTFGLGHYTINI